MPDLDAAEQFLAAHGRVLERRRFGRAFRGGSAGSVRDAVAAYRNDDGGIGHAMEPDGRGPGSQPAATMTALGVLDASDAWDDDLARGACDWLATVAPPGGGATFVLPGVEAWPHGPWWQPAPGLPASLTTTGPLLAPLLRRGLTHPWVDAAAAWIWSALEAPAGDLQAYDLRGALLFLDAVRDDARTAGALARLAPSVTAATTVPDVSGETHGPLKLAPTPGHPAIGTLLDADALERDLDELAAGQRADGGWTFDFPEWSPAATADWRGVTTVEALLTLRAHGRLP